MYLETARAVSRTSNRSANEKQKKDMYDVVPNRASPYREIVWIADTLGHDSVSFFQHLRFKTFLSHRFCV